MDYNGTCKVTGGTLAIAGSSGMVQPGTSSSQNSITVIYHATQAAGTLATLTDESGKTVLAFAPAKAYQSIVFSSPLLENRKPIPWSPAAHAAANSATGCIPAAPVPGVLNWPT